MTIETHEAALKAARDGRLSIAAYLAICREKGWPTDMPPTGNEAIIDAFLDRAEERLRRNPAAVDTEEFWVTAPQVLTWLRSINNTDGPDRLTVMRACRVLGAIRHRDMDSLLNVFGIDRLKQACSGMGSGMQARASAMEEFSLNYPAALTAEGVPIQVAVVQAAAQLIDQASAGPPCA